MPKRYSAGTDWSMCVQPTFLIGTYNEDGTPDFAPITWLSAAYNSDHFVIVVSMDGTKKTKQNVQRSGLLSANLVSVDMLPLTDYLGSVSGHKGLKTAMEYGVREGEVLKVPTLDDSRWVYELEVENSIVNGSSETFFCAVRNVQVAEGIDVSGGIDLTKFDPVVYSGHYHSLNEHLGEIGDFLKK